jgi:hypothetical protein
VPKNHGRKRSKKQRREKGRFRREDQVLSGKIAKLEEKKQTLLAPKMTPNQIIKAAHDKGWTTEQIIKKLGIDPN